MLSSYKKLSVLAFILCPLVVCSQINISTEAELEGMANVLDGNYVLVNDIVLSKEWTPIGLSAPFTGVLNGNGHAIFNLSINDDTQSTVGLFARTEGAEIKNLGIDNATIRSEKTGSDGSVGILVGEAKSTSVSQVFIKGGTVNGKGSIGSLIGREVKGEYATEISNSYAEATSLVGSSNVGGLVGTAGNIRIENSYFPGTAEAEYACGGIVGAIYGDGHISSCAVLSPLLKGRVYVYRIIGSQYGGYMHLSGNYARFDMRIGYRNPVIVSASETSTKNKQGENIPYGQPEFVSTFPAYTESNIATSLQAFNQRFYSNSKNLYYERSTLSGKVAAIWTQAIYWDIITNVYKKTGSESDKTAFENVFKGNGTQYANYNWDNGEVWFIYDDIMWWVISLANAYELTREVKYLDLSTSGFERVWSGSKVLKDNGSYDPVNGGMYWAWEQANPEGSPLPSMGKMACINYPTVIAAMTLFNATGDHSYYNKGLEIYNWARNNLFDLSIGRVADSKHGSGNPAWVMHVYNQATCIGAAVMVYKATGDRKYLEDAILAANYTKNQMSVNGGMLHFETGVEQGIYHAIFAQYIARLIDDCEQYQYLPWLRYNIDCGWGNRLSSNNVVYKDYANPAPAILSIESYDASGIPALMQVIPPAEGDNRVADAKSSTFYKKTLNWDFESTWKFAESDTLPSLSFPSLSSIKKETAPKAVMYNKDGTLFVNSASPIVVEVFDSTGCVSTVRAIEGGEGIQLPNKGLYIVRASMGQESIVQKIINR